MFGENTCISCHKGWGAGASRSLGLVESVHAQRGVGCVSCHGGDPTKADAEESMSPEAGYLGPTQGKHPWSVRIVPHPGGLDAAL